MKTTILIPTYKRPKDLARCLESLKYQNRLPDEVIVVVRDIDTETWALFNNKDYSPLALRTVTVTIPGQVAALNKGLDEAKGDIIAITDDDAAPLPHWLETIESHFLSDEHVGGVGGRDWIFHNGTERDDGTSLVVGKVQWFGRVIGRHNLGIGEPREVELLKGANMSYRRKAIHNLHFDERLLGSGAQVHNDLAFSLAVKRSGWKLIYDPKVELNHYIAQRFDEDQRDQFNSKAFFNAVHNETLALLDYLPAQRKLIFLIWAILIGTRKGFGLVQLIRFLPAEGKLAGQKWFLTMKGRWQGWLTYRNSKQNQVSFA